MIVMMIAITPSLNASNRPLVIFAPLHLPGSDASCTSNASFVSRQANTWPLALCRRPPRGKTATIIVKTVQPIVCNPSCGCACHGLPPLQNPAQDWSTRRYLPEGQGALVLFGLLRNEPSP